MVFPVSMTPEEQIIANGYASLHGLTLPEALKRALFERIEDEQDLAEYNEAYAEYVQDGMKSRPIEEIWTELGI